MKTEEGMDAMTNSAAKKTAYYGMFVALAFVFSYIEVLIPFSIGIPGVKLGLANLVVLIALYAMGTKESFIISTIRIILIGFTFGNMSMIIYSLAGGLFSWLVMVLCKKTKLFSITGVSIAGGISHNIGQIIVAALFLENINLIYYLAVLLVVGTITGFIIGILGALLLKIKIKY